MKPYRDYSDFLAGHFGGKMQKVAVNAGFTCPNRDGTVGRGGCTYCNNLSFNPSYCSGTLSVTEQIRRGCEFFARKYPEMRYLAYFQAYTSTHGRDIDALMSLYSEAMECQGVEGVVIATRPDCVSPTLLDRLAAGLPWVMIEYGAESAHDRTLRLVNRGHTWADTVRAVNLTAERGIPVGLHLINGLPGETEQMMLETVDRINELPVDVVKFHQLQLLRGTTLARQAEVGEVDITNWTADEYASLCAKIVGRLRPDIAIDRWVSQAPSEMVISPRWGLKNYQFTEIVKSKIINTEKWK